MNLDRFFGELVGAIALLYVLACVLPIITPYVAVLAVVGMLVRLVWWQSGGR